MTLAAAWLLPMVCLALASAAENGRRRNFMSAGPGSASVALGEAMIAKGVDSSAGFYNPATLVGQPSSVLFEYAQPNIGANRSWLAFAIGDRRLKTGLTWKHESLPLSSSKNGFLMSVGISDQLVKYLPKGMSLGATVGYVQETIASYSAASFLANVGGAYSRVDNKWHYGVGATIRNLYFSGLKFREEGDTEMWPKELDMGLFVSRWGVTLFGALEVEKQGTPSAGLAWSPFPFLEFRAGMNDDLRFGAGIEVRKFRVDYAMKTGQLQNTHHATLSYLWGKSEQATDYTNPLNELEAKYEALAESMLAELKRNVQGGEMPSIAIVLKLLAVDFGSGDGWSFYTTLTGEKRFKARLPRKKIARKHYLEFAVAYANGAANARELAERFVQRYPDEKAARLVREILQRDTRLTQW
jgi:hypothetical protein